MTGAQSPQSSPAGSSRHAKELTEFRQRISQDDSIGSQLRAGGEPGLLGASGVDDETLLRWLKAEKCVGFRMHLLMLCFCTKPRLYHHTISLHSHHS